MQETRREILISIKPKWVALILSGRKTVEVRKRFPKDYRGWVYIYCTKGKPNLWLPYEYDCFEQDEASQPYSSDEPILDIDAKMNGKAVGRFWCGQVEEFYEFNNDLCEKACIGRGEILDYLGDESGYAIHISKLEIYGDPKGLGEFHPYCKDEKREYANNYGKTWALTKEELE